MAFKMKGSPMKRNFGIGASPVKQKTWPGKPDPTKETPEQAAKRKETFKKAFEKSKKKGGKKDFKDMKPGDLGIWGDKIPPLKQRTTTTYTDEDLEGGEKKVTTVKGRENKKGQSQSDVMNMRWKKYQDAWADLNALGEKITKYGKDKWRMLSDKKQKEIIADLERREQSVKDMRKDFVHSADSIGTRNIMMDKAADSDWD